MSLYFVLSIAGQMSTIDFDLLLLRSLFVRFVRSPVCESYGHHHHLQHWYGFSDRLEISSGCFDGLFAFAFLSV